MKKIILFLPVFLLFVVRAEAAPITVTNASSAGWVQIGTSNTFGLPANLVGIGCGAENETSCEPLGVFNFNVAFAHAAEFDILDQGAVLSDQIKVFNDPTTGLGVVTFASDPSLASIVPTGLTLCVEQSFPVGNGCTQSFAVVLANGSTITLTAASDAEAHFDPFGLGADSSDELQITGGAVIAPSPEPTSLMLMGSGLVALLLKRRYR